MSIYDSLNKEQKEAVFCTEGPLLMLAGAGSGKTRSITHRIAYLIEEAGVRPWNILAITFTNKAAQEMRERVDDLLGFGGGEVWVSTFHSMCSRLLRRHIDVIGYDRNFTIYDTSDQKSLMKDVLKQLNVNTKQFPERAMLAAISSAKNEYISPSEYRKQHAADFRESKIADIYDAYQKRLRDNSALDFDDLLVKTVEMFEASPEILDQYQERFRYIMVDEYQDTNTVQFMLVSMLARKYRNLCVVGDDDQSIYKFRGANIYNILNFEKVFPDARVIRLEQNYRSTGNILNAANEVIRNNKGRKEKRLWTDKPEGELVHFTRYENEYEEAEGVVKQINFLNMRQVPWQDMAILYRTNAQSRIFEEKLKQRNIPYAIVRGVSFYDRKEIKDLMSYFKVIDRGTDDLAARRIINVPRRGIGQTSINRLADYAMVNEINFMDAVYKAREIPGMGRGASRIREFADLIDDFRAYADSHPISDLLTYILETTGYREELEAEGTDEAVSRLQDIDELYNDIIYYEDNEDDPNLTGFLAEKDMYTLNAGIDNLEDDDNKVLLMTLHNAKGLEFKNVFIGGLEDGIFPGYGSIVSGDPSEIEEERRLCYVGITRAEERLYLSAAERRMVNGRTQYNMVSRFVSEIPDEYIKLEGQGYRSRRSGNDGSGFLTGSGHAFDAGGWSGSSGSPGRDYGTGSQGGQGRRAGAGGSRRRSGFEFGIGGSKGNQGSKGGYSLSDFKVSSITPDYSIGDRVRHIKFGEGTVMELVQGGKDYEVTVEFDRVGKKKMFASFAKLKRL